MFNNKHPKDRLMTFRRSGFYFSLLVLVTGVASCSSLPATRSSGDQATGSQASKVSSYSSHASHCLLDEPGAVCEQLAAADSIITTLEKDIAAQSGSVYRTYLATDPDYVKDLQGYIQQSAQAWARYADSQCLLEPYINGMSRREMEDVAERCRLQMANTRISKLNELLGSLMSNRE